MQILEPAVNTTAAVASFYSGEIKQKSLRADESRSPSNRFAVRRKQSHVAEEHGGDTPPLPAGELSVAAGWIKRILSNEEEYVVAARIERPHDR